MCTDGRYGVDLEGDLCTRCKNVLCSRAVPGDYNVTIVGETL